MGETRQTKQDAKKAAKEMVLDDMAFGTLFRFYRGPGSWTGFNEWFEATKTVRGKQGLGNDTFSDSVKRLIEAERVRKSFPDGLYQVVLEGGAKDASTSSEAAPGPVPPPPPTPGSSLLKEGGAPGVRSGPGSAPGSARSNSTESGNGQDSVGPDAAFEAVEQLNRKAQKSD
jgi:hypothetical protein